MPRLSPHVRFEKNVMPEPNSGCWLWMGALNRDGYSNFSVYGKFISGYRWSYENFVGPIPKGLTIDHLCGVRSCVNPDHLEAVTHRENCLRGNTIAANNASRTHCPKNHPYSGENLIIRPNGSRACRECARIKGRARYWRKTGRDIPVTTEQSLAWGASELSQRNAEMALVKSGALSIEGAHAAATERRQQAGLSPSDANHAVWLARTSA